MNRVTVIVPVSKAEAANHTHIALGKAKDLNSCIEPNYQDAQGNLYHVSSGLWTETQIAGVKNPLIMGELELPENSKAGLTKVQDAQANFTMCEITYDENDVIQLSALPSLSKIVAVEHEYPLQILEMLGLVPVETPEI